MSQSADGPQHLTVSDVKETKKYNPRLVICMHGIRTWARWQKIAAELLGNHGIKFKLYDFGWYGLHRFIWDSSNERMVDAFYDQYTQILKQHRAIDPTNYLKRPSIIAHSFGTYLVGKCMLKYDSVRIDKLILCGSILPKDFDWGTLLARNQVNLVRNEYGVKDFWSGIVKHFVRGTGSSGRDGFGVISTVIEEQRFEQFRHSDYFHSGHMEAHWIPFLQIQPINLVVRHGRETDNREEFASILKETRANIDAPSFGSLPHHEESALPWGLSLSWIDSEPDIYTFLLDRQNRLQGYINAMPLRKEVFDKVKGGTIMDKELSREFLVPFVSGGPLAIYLMSIATAPSVRKTNQGLFSLAVEKLLNGLFDKLIYYAEKTGVKVEELVAIPWTAEGLRLCRIFGMQQVGSDKFSNPIYYLSFKDPGLLKKRRLFSGMRRLLRTYGELDSH
jgi:pimeloyl-ACP methyl ester carboxylesterase